MSKSTDLTEYRRFFAEEIEAVAKLRTPGLADALAVVAREQFLPPGPWTVLATTDWMPTDALWTTTTPDSDPRRVYHNIVVAIDPARQLFNGQPSTLTAWIDALALAPGARVLHIGSGLGYYTALLAQAVGPSGHVVAYEVDEVLASEARQNLAYMSWVDVRHGDSSSIDQTFDAVLVNAGVTHPLDAWLDALVPQGRMIVPMTSMMPAMGGRLGKGLVWVLTKRENLSLAARTIGLVSIYSAIGVRDETLNEKLGKAMMAGPAQWQAVATLRRDAHEVSPSCWFHSDRCCLTRA